MFYPVVSRIFTVFALIVGSAILMLTTACYRFSSETPGPHDFPTIPPTATSALPIMTTPTENPTPGLAETEMVETNQVYQNPELRIMLQFPADWKLLDDTPFPQYYRGEDGFVQISSLAASGMTLEQVVQAELDSDSFGSSPVIETRQFDGLDGRVIFPSSDQPRLDPGDPFWGLVLIPFPIPVLVKDTLNNYLVLKVNQDNLDAVLESVVFEDASKAGSIFPAVSTSPAAGICDQQNDSQITVTISIDVPSPRCIKIGPHQMLRLVNGTGEVLKVKLAWYEILFQPQEARSLNIPVGSYLAPGVHRIEVLTGIGNAPEIWVLQAAETSSSNVLLPEKGSVQGVPRFSADGSILALPTSSGITLLDGKNLDLLSTLEVVTGTEYLAFSPDGTRLASGGGWFVQLWQKSESDTLGDWTLLRALTGSISSPESKMVDLGFSPDGHLLAAGFKRQSDPPDGAVLLWSALDGEFNSSYMGMLFDFSPIHGRLVAVWMDREENFIYSYSMSGAPTDIFRGDEAFFSPSGLLATRFENSWRLTNMVSGNTELSLDGDQLTFSADGKSLVIFEHGHVNLYRVQDGVLLKVLQGNWEQAEQFVFSPDGKTLAGTVAGCWTGDVCENPMPHNVVWSLSSGRVIFTASSDELYSWMTYSPDGMLLVFCSQGGKIEYVNIGFLGE